MDSNNLKLVAAEEENKISKAVRTWLNTYPSKPLTRVDFEFLGESSGLTLATMQGAYITKQYVCGGYQAQYQFKIIYRTSTQNMVERLDSDAVLNKFGAWCEQNYPDLGDNIRVVKVQRSSLAGLYARYEDGIEDHQIMITITYEVI